MINIILIIAIVTVANGDFQGYDYTPPKIRLCLDGTARESCDVCPEGTVGTYPDCMKSQCPPGTTGSYPDCHESECPQGTYGPYPNCMKLQCPPGTIGIYPNCKDEPSQGYVYPRPKIPFEFPSVGYEYPRPKISFNF